LARITSEQIDAREVVRAVLSPACGAVLTFAGTVREEHLGRRVTAIEYHAYDSMAEKELTRIEGEVSRRWPGLRVRILHRTGLLQVGETSVFIAVASPHRAEGFEGLRYTIDTLKETVPIWKKEIYTNGHTWIEGS
jgi:molybdopterin synthase catalytic subunit